MSRLSALYRLLVLVVQPGIAAAAGSDANPEKHGYWWYEDPPKEFAEVEATPKHPDLPPPPSAAILETMHPQDVEKMIKDYRQYALWKMTDEHVKWYFQLQNYATRRSSEFANTASLVALKYPELAADEHAYPTNSVGRAAYTAQRSGDMERLLDSQRGKAALVMFVKDGCSFCEAQRSVMKYFQAEHGWEVKEVNVGLHPDMAAKFNVQSTPTVIVIVRGSADWMPVSIGVETLPEIEEKLYRVLRYLNGETTPAQFNLRAYEQEDQIEAGAYATQTDRMVAAQVENSQ